MIHSTLTSQRSGGKPIMLPDRHISLRTYLRINFFILVSVLISSLGRTRTDTTPRIKGSSTVKLRGFRLYSCCLIPHGRHLRHHARRSFR